MYTKEPETEGVVVHIDGGSRGNPGPAAYAVVVQNAEGACLASFAKFLGRATNNVAEYQGLLAALSYALEHHYSRVKVVSDSELMVRQLTGQYKVKNPDLKILHERAKYLISQLGSFTVKHALREHNREADRLVNQALDVAEGRKRSKVSCLPALQPLRASAIYHQGVLRLRETLPLDEGEEVSVEIHRTKAL